MTTTKARLSKGVVGLSPGPVVTGAVSQEASVAHTAKREAGSSVMSDLYQIFGIIKRIMQLERNSLSQLVIGTPQLMMNSGTIRSGP